MSTCHITVNFNLDCLAKMVSAGFLYGKITIFLFIINKYLRGDTLRLCHPILKILLTNFSNHWWILSAAIILTMVFYFPYSVYAC